MLKILVTWFLSLLPLQFLVLTQAVDNYSQHPCRRICHRGERPKICDYSFEIAWSATDSRPLITVNGQFPGPTLEVCKGDRIRLTVQNALQTGETTTIHFHGARQRHSQFMDGAPFVTQCPVQPNAEFVMEFTAEDAGTHFWRGLVGLQRANGLAGSFIVRDPYDANAALYDIDNHAPLLLQNWFDTKTAKFSDFTNQSLLVNGRCQATFPTFSFDSTYKHRLRVINNAFLECPMKLTLQGHHLKLIATDGHPIKAQTTQTLTVYPGERYDFVPVFTGEFVSPTAVYSLQVTGENQCATSSPGLGQVAYLEGANPSVVNESDVAVSVVSNLRRLPLEVVTNETLEIDLLESLSTDRRIFESEPDLVMTFDLDYDEVKNPHNWPFDPTGNGLYTPRINQITSKSLPVSLMSQSDDVPVSSFCNSAHRKCDADEYCECTNIINIPMDTLVELILIANSRHLHEAIHPMHMHGYSLHVLAMESLHVNVSKDEITFMHFNGTLKRKPTALVKDTVTVPPGGYAVVRFVADNPGLWMFHSNADYQLVQGMSMLFSVGTKRDLPKTPVNWPKCGDWEPSSGTTSTNFGQHSTVLLFALFFRLLAQSSS